MADAVNAVAQQAQKLGGEGFETALYVAAGVVVSALLAPMLNFVVAPLSNWVAQVFPQAAYAVPALVNLAAAAVLLVFINNATVANVAMGMAIYSALIILAPLLTMAGQMVGGLTASLTRG